MKLHVKQAFDWAHRHVDVKHYDPGDEIDASDEPDLAEVAIREGWAEGDAAAGRDESKAHTAAPENKDAAPKRKTKA